MVMVQIHPQSRQPYGERMGHDEDESAAVRTMAMLEQIGSLRPEWMLAPDRNCAGIKTELFYGSDVAAAICEGCTYQVACLWYALDNDEDYGVWGGTSERQRRKIKKRLRNG
jgi:hypothetical protein